MIASTAVEQNAPPWLTDFYAKVDSLALDDIVAGFTPEATMQFGSEQPVAGRAAIGAGLTGLFSMLTSMTHTIHKIWTSGSTTLMEATVTYHLAGGGDVPIPVVTILERPDELIAGIRIFLDRTPLSG